MSEVLDSQNELYLADRVKPSLVKGLSQPNNISQQPQPASLLPSPATASQPAQQAPLLHTNTGNS
ncbi:hypothetical protein E2C01_029010 [Portunus trituberculatus]|uniref:Uncharacterized protein n=1 Tax=Portunus trituberculatus TaxID=210409 RepID=A0A5B7EQB9_PORTR|nr:hypothetical protein [Portunus trituberculatus]